MQISQVTTGTLSPLVLGLTETLEAEREDIEDVMVMHVREMVDQHAWMKKELERQKTEVEKKERALGLSASRNHSVRIVNSNEHLKVTQVIERTLLLNHSEGSSFFQVVSEELQREREEIMLLIAEYVERLLQDQEWMGRELLEQEQRITQLEGRVQQKRKQEKLRLEQERLERLMSIPLEEALKNYSSAASVIYSLKRGTSDWQMFSTRRCPESSILKDFYTGTRAQPPRRDGTPNPITYWYCVPTDKQLIPFFEKAMAKNLTIIEAYLTSGYQIPEYYHGWRDILVWEERS